MDWLTAYKIPLGTWIKSLVDLLNAHAAGFFDFISWALGRPDRRHDRGADRRPAAAADRAVRRCSPGCLHRSLAARGAGRRLACC